MLDSPFYHSKRLVPVIQSQETLQFYNNVTIELKDLKVVDLVLKVTSHRLLLQSNSDHMFLIEGQKISQVSSGEQGFFNKDYFVNVMISGNRKVKIYMKQCASAINVIKSMMLKKAWLIVKQTQAQYKMYSGIWQQLKKKQSNVAQNQIKVIQSFSSFDNLMGNLKELKKIMGQFNLTSVQQQNSQLNKIIKNIGFIQVASKNEAGSNYIKAVASNLNEICEKVLFKEFGGMVPLLDLFYFYNSKRRMEFISPEQLLQSCQLFETLGYHAKLVHYSNNIKIIQSTTFNPQQDFDNNFKQFFQTYNRGYTAEQISKIKNLPISIIQIKLRNALKMGWLALDDRIQGLTYFKNIFCKI